MERSLIITYQFIKNDKLLIDFTYKDIIDEVIANVGRSKVDKKAIRDQVRADLEMMIENMEENLMLCIDNMLAEIKGDEYE